MQSTSRNNNITMPAVSMAVNTNTSTDEYKPEGFNHGNSPSPIQTASDQGLLSNNRTITQADPPDQAQQLNAFPSQESPSENTMTHLHLLADTALKYAKGSSYTNQAKAPKKNALNKANAIARAQKILQLNSQEINPKTHKIKKPKSYECHFIINTLTNKICDKKFSLKVKFETHKKSHSEEKRLSCSLCDKKYKCTLLFNTHMLKHTHEKPLFCDLCRKEFSRKYSLKRHMLMHEKKPFFCNICNKRYSRESNFIEHEYKCRKKSYSCNICNNTYTKSSNLKRHEKSHGKSLSGKKTFICDRCNTTFINQISINKHHKLGLCFITHTSEQLNYSNAAPLTQTEGGQCLLLNTRTITQTQLDAIPSQESADKDSTPDLNLLDNTALKHPQGSSDTHKTKAAQTDGLSNAPEMHVCNFIININTNQTCLQKFSGKVELTEHIKTHTNNKYYTCSCGNKQFRSLSHLTRHQRIHTNKKPYICDVCTKAFSDSSNLKKHKITHTKNKPYLCIICNKSFPWQSSLSRHEYIHARNKSLPAYPATNRSNKKATSIDT